MPGVWKNAGMRVTCMWISHDVMDIMMSKLLDAGERERERERKRTVDLWNTSG